MKRYGYRNAEKRLSNEFLDATGAALGAGVGVAASASIAGFNGGRVATCLGLPDLSAVFSVPCAGRFSARAGRSGAVWAAGAAVFGLAEAGCLVVVAVVAVVSAVPKPILRARLLKILLDGEGASSYEDGLVASASGSNGVATVAVAESRGGLTVGGMVPGAVEYAVSFSPGSAGSDSPV